MRHIFDNEHNVSFPEPPNISNVNASRPPDGGARVRAGDRQPSRELLTILGARKSLQQANTVGVEGHARADPDPPAGWPDALRQSAGADRQQARTEAVGIVQHRAALTRTTSKRGQHDEQHRLESSGQQCQALGVNWKSLAE
ncbi:hypothetical protein ACFPPA_00150 [Rhodanobacter ginsengisoli]|uniref:Uncharacterized protein n=1 Tax=Rhodanobacter ginsengisoli TaxID=418646 RepID=A0ABW0QH88_9GAMM